MNIGTSDLGFWIVISLDMNNRKGKRIIGSIRLLFIDFYSFWRSGSIISTKLAE